MDSASPSLANLDAVVFDYGGVLCHTPPDAELREFAALAGLPEDRFRQLYGEMRGPYDRGVISTAQYWEALGRAAGLGYDADRIRALGAMDLRIWSRLDERMIALAARLRQAGLRTGILSNMHSDLREIFRREAAWLRHFDVQLFSCDFGLIKPEPAIYQRLLEALGVPAHRVFFIDDLPANIEAARQAGIGGMVYRSFEELSARLVC